MKESDDEKEGMWSGEGNGKHLEAVSSREFWKVLPAWGYRDLCLSHQLDQLRVDWGCPTFHSCAYFPSWLRIVLNHLSSPILFI